MWLLWVVLWTVGSILLFTDMRSSVSRWGSAVAFTSGCGGLAVFISRTVRPFVQANIPHGGIMDRLLYMDGIISILSTYAAPYTLLIFGLVYSKALKGRKLLIAQGAACIPVVWMILLYPVFPYFEPEYSVLTLWVGPYVVGANTLFLLTFLREKNHRARRQHLFTAMLVVPTTMFSLMTNYVLRAFGIENGWKFNTFIIVLQFLLFVGLAVRYGVLGIRLRVDKHRLESTMKAIHSGTAILNHTIKNEIMKISLCSDNIAELSSDPALHENLKVIQASTAHMMEMVSRIQKHMHDIVLKEERYVLGELVDRALLTQAPKLRHSNITVRQNYGYEEEVICDGIHFVEVLNNILNNATEALKGKGEIEVSVKRSGGVLSVMIRDNGPGIPRETLPYVLDPFYSTKKGGLNFGLGLSYCYNVMRAGGGSLEILSKEKEGTTVMLHFPEPKYRRNIDKLTSAVQHS